MFGDITHLLLEGFVKIIYHLMPDEISLSNLIEFCFHIGGKFVIHNPIKMLFEKVSHYQSHIRRDKFSFGGAGFHR